MRTVDPRFRFWGLGSLVPDCWLPQRGSEVLAWVRVRGSGVRGWGLGVGGWGSGVGGWGLGVGGWGWGGGGGWLGVTRRDSSPPPTISRKSNFGFR